MNSQLVNRCQLLVLALLHHTQHTSQSVCTPHSTQHTSQSVRTPHSWSIVVNCLYWHSCTTHSTPHSQYVHHNHTPHHTVRTYTTTTQHTSRSVRTPQPHSTPHGQYVHHNHTAHLTVSTYTTQHITQSVCTPHSTPHGQYVHHTAGQSLSTACTGTPAPHTQHTSRSVRTPHSTPHSQYIHHTAHSTPHSQYVHHTAGQSLSTACTGTPAPHTVHLTVSTYTTQLVNRCQLLVLALLHHTVSQTARLIITLLLLLQSMQLRRYSIIFGFVESIRDARV